VQVQANLGIECVRPSATTLAAKHVTAITGMLGDQTKLPL
jgi:hypothetical protein